MLETSREETIFNEAINLPAAEREAFLERECQGQPEWRARVDALLQAHQAAGDFLDPLPFPAAMRTERNLGTVACAIQEKPGDVVGRYKLLQNIGEGGWGAVYMAEQERPIRRRVALKIIKLGMDTKQVIARFEAERQALAMMDHPNIARVLDAGATDSGRPYFVMELVRGVRITQYCDSNNLSTSERLALFVQVCNAIQHAHQKGIIHRDIKPSNILVTLHDGMPVPKVIDFGIAKATQGRLTDQTLFTAFEQFIGTPAYMSPEQAEMSGLDIDTRSDIYSLGVLLYELLTGSTPFDPTELAKAGLDEIRRRIREQEPPRPSTRLSTLVGDALTNASRHRQTDSRRLVGTIRGDLDWIVMKCLEKDRTRRYETANGVASDVRRHLSNELIVARPPSATYRFRKMVRRNRVAFAAITAVTLALVVGGTFSTWQAIRATRAERDQSRLRELAVADRNRAEELRIRAETDEKKAQTEAARSEQVARFMKEMLKGVGPRVAMGRDTVLLREILDQTEQRLSRDLQGQPEVEADLRQALGTIYTELGEYAKAEAMLREALRIDTQSFGQKHATVAADVHSLGALLHRQGKYVEAKDAFRQALQIRRELLSGDHPDIATTLEELGGTQRMIKVEDGAEALARESLAMRRRLFGNEHVDVAKSLSNLGLILNGLDRPSEAEAAQREALAMRRKLLSNDHPDTLGLIVNLGHTLVLLGRLAEAETNMRDALAIQRKMFRGQNLDVAQSLAALGDVLRRQTKWAEAEATLQEATAIYRDLGINSTGRHVATNNLILVLLAQNKLADAEAVCREKLMVSSKETRQRAIAQLCDILCREQKVDEASTILKAAFNEFRPKNDANNAAVTALVRAVNQVAWAAFLEGRATDGIASAEVGLAESKSWFGNFSPSNYSIADTLGWLYLSQGHPERAIPLFEECLAMYRNPAAPDVRPELRQLENLGIAHRHAGGFQESKKLLEQALHQRDPTDNAELTKGDPSVGSYASTLYNLGATLIAMENFPQAEIHLRQALSIIDGQDGNVSVRFAAASLLGDALRAQQKFFDAEPLVVQGYEGLLKRRNTIAGNRQKLLTEALHRVIQLYADWEKPDQANQWKGRLAEIDVLNIPSVQPSDIHDE